VLVRLLPKASLADLGPSAMLVLTQALWFSIPFGVRYAGIETGIEPFDRLSIRFYVILTAVAHSVQYIWVTTYYAEASADFHGRFSHLRKVAMAGIAVWTIPVILFAPDGIGTLSYDAGLALLLAAAVNIHHFILDGAIWKLRSSRVGNVLIRDVHETPGEEIAERAWLRRAVWSATAGAAVIAIAVFWEREVKIPRIFAAQKYEEASATLNRLAWVGRDESALRLRLIQEASGRGDLPSAIEQARRLLVLRPGFSTHGNFARLLESGGDWEGALEQYESGRLMEPEDPGLIRGAALALLELNRPEEALALLEPLSIRFPTDSQTLDGIERARSMLDDAPPR
jgi:tetratricopeptide (TPR) repeat protein